MSNEELAVLAKAGDELATYELLQQVDKFLWKKVHSNHIPGMELEDMYSEAKIMFMETVYKYTPEKYKFITLLGAMIQNRYRHMIRDSNAKKRQHIHMSWDELVAGTDGLTICDQLASDSNVEDEFCEKDDVRNIMACLRQLPERKQQIMQGVMQGNSQKHISKQMGISQAYVGRLQRQTVNTIREKLCVGAL